MCNLSRAGKAPVRKPAMALAWFDAQDVLDLSWDHREVFNILHRGRHDADRGGEFGLGRGRHRQHRFTLF